MKIVHPLSPERRREFHDRAMAASAAREPVYVTSAEMDELIASLPEPEGSRTLSEIVALNVRTYRAARGLKQSDLAAAVASLGHPWVQATVSALERGSRRLTVDELGALAVVLHVSIPRLCRSLVYDTPQYVCDGEQPATMGFATLFDVPVVVRDQP